MLQLQAFSRQHHCLPKLVLVSAVIFLVSLTGPAGGQQKKIDVLKIGTSGTMTNEKDDKEKEAAALETLRAFIKEETLLDNAFENEPNWNVLAQKMSEGKIHLGLFRGDEFAWAEQKYPELKPLALAINVYRYPVAYVVAQKDKGPKDVAGLKGQTIAVPATNQPFLRLFLEHLSQVSAKLPVDQFFAKITSSENTDDALDDVVDGIVQAASVDRTALEAFRRRKPGRFNQLKEVAQSGPFPPVIVAYYDKVLPDETLKKFQKGLLTANQKEKGQTILTLFHMTGFEAVPEDFAKVLEQTRKTYPPPVLGKEQTK